MSRPLLNFGDFRQKDHIPLYLNFTDFDLIEKLNFLIFAENRCFCKHGRELLARKLSLRKTFTVIL